MSTFAVLMPQCVHNNRLLHHVRQNRNAAFMFSRQHELRHDPHLRLSSPSFEESQVKIQQKQCPNKHKDSFLARRETHLMQIWRGKQLSALCKQNIEVNTQFFKLPCHLHHPCLHLSVIHLQVVDSQDHHLHHLHL